MGFNIEDRYWYIIKNKFKEIIEVMMTDDDYQPLNRALLVKFYEFYVKIRFLEHYTYLTIPGKINLRRYHLKYLK